MLAGGVGALAGAGSAGGAGTPGSGAARTVASVGSNTPGATGSGGGASVPPPLDPISATGSEGGGARRQPAPPTVATSAIAQVGGDPLAGSGFESEKPVRGYSGNTDRSAASASTGPGAAPPISSSNSVAGSSSGRPANPPPGGRSAGSTAERVQGAFGGASAQFRAIRRRLGPFPSDSAPHASPPRMPIDHSD